MNLLSTVKNSITSIIGITIVASFASFGIFDTYNSWANVKPVFNSSQVSYILNKERDAIKDSGGDTSAPVNFGVIQDGLLDELAYAEQAYEALTPEQQKISGFDRNASVLYSGTVVYIEGTYDAFCVVSFNDTNFESGKRTILHASDAPSVAEDLSIRGACKEGVLERAEEFGMVIDGNGGLAVA